MSLPESIRLALFFFFFFASFFFLFLSALFLFWLCCCNASQFSGLPLLFCCRIAGMSLVVVVFVVGVGGVGGVGVGVVGKGGTGGVFWIEVEFVSADRCDMLDEEDASNML